MTKEQILDILHILELDYEAEPTLIYLFFQLPDGRINNYSISVRSGGNMSDKEIEELMRRQQPSTRQARVLTVERPDWTPPVEWLDTAETCQLLKITPRTLRRWTRQGLFHPTLIGQKYYYLRDEIENVLRRNAILDNGRFDKTAIKKHEDVP